VLRAIRKKGRALWKREAGYHRRSLVGSVENLCIIPIFLGMRNDQTTRPMSKSPLRIARTARRIAERALPRYSSTYSPRCFTQAPLFACRVLRQFFRTDYRGVVALLEDFPELRQALKLKRLPHYSTLCYAQHRLLRSARIRALQRELLRAVPASKRATAIADATGLETRPVSRYYVERQGKRSGRRRFPKLSLLAEAESHLIAGAHISLGPSPLNCAPPGKRPPPIGASTASSLMPPTMPSITMYWPDRHLASAQP
jgi:hypothetical protein